MKIFDLKTLHNLSNKMISFSTGSRKLDEVLNGGFKTYSIYEIYGEAGSGKTRLLHQLAYMFCYKTNRKAYYIDNDLTFRPQILEKFHINFGGDLKEISNRIFITQPLNENQFIESLEKLKDIDDSLLLIDTLTTHLRALKETEYEREIKEVLKKILKISMNNCCVVFSNQVRFDEKSSDLISPLGGRTVNEIINVKLKLVNEINRIRCEIESYNEKHKKSVIFLSLTDKGLL